MKRIILIVFGLLFLLSSCIKCREIEKPKNLKPIDWKNYNDVYDVYWNSLAYCSDVDIWAFENAEEIKIYGWISNAFNEYPAKASDFSLINDFSEIYAPNTSKTSRIYIDTQFLTSEELEKLQAKLDMYDYEKRCFLQGDLIMSCAETTTCSKAYPVILLRNVDSVYFE